MAAQGILGDGMIRVSWVLSIANMAAPVAASELNAASSVLLHPTLTPDGLIGFELDTQGMEITALVSGVDAAQAGRDKLGDLRLRLYKLSGTDSMYSVAKGTNAFVAIRRYMSAATSWATGQSAQIYSVQAGTKKEMLPAQGEAFKYEIPLFSTADPVLNAVVA